MFGLNRARSIFAFLDSGKEGGVTHEQLADGVGTIFSPADNDDARFYFSVYE